MDLLDAEHVHCFRLQILIGFLLLHCCDTEAMFTWWHRESRSPCAGMILCWHLAQNYYFYFFYF